MEQEQIQQSTEIQINSISQDKEERRQDSNKSQANENGPSFKELEGNTTVTDNSNQENSSNQINKSRSVEGLNNNQKEVETTKQNPMRNIEIEKIILHCGGIGDKLERSVKLLEMIAKGRKIYKVKSTKRIPAFNISPGKQSGAKVTIRNKQQINDLLKRFFAALDNTIPKKQITENNVDFGINEYIEVPGLEYSRDIGILGFEVSIVFKRKGKRTMMKKIKRGKLPKKQHVTEEEIIQYLNKNFGVEVE